MVRVRVGFGSGFGLGFGLGLIRRWTFSPVFCQSYHSYNSEDHC